MRMMIRLAPAMLGLLLLCGGEAQARTRKSRVMTFEATANSVEGTTASGRGQRTRLVAADPDVLPLGTRIRVLNAGPFSGVYTVADTGPKVQGRKIDFYLPDDAAAKARRPPAPLRDTAIHLDHAAPSPGARPHQ